MTYHEKLNELHNAALKGQAEFLKVIEEIRKHTAKGEALDEELIFKRDKIYNEFNKALKEHRRLQNFIESKGISMDSEFQSNYTDLL
jgi:hypothetical protein